MRSIPWTIASRVNWRVNTLLLRHFEPGCHYPLGLRLRRALYPLLSSSGFVRSAHGGWHYLSTDPIDTIVIAEILGWGRTVYFPPLEDDVRAALHGGGYLLDLGAFNGGWTIEMLQRYPGARAIAVEPNPEKCRAIERGIAASGLASRVTIVQAAVAESSGAGWLLASPEGSWGRSFAATPPAGAHAADRVRAMTLGDILQGVTPIVVKCNIEGGEYIVARQLAQARITPARMIVMVHPEHGDPRQLRADLTRAGQRIIIARESAHRPVWHVVAPRAI